MNIREFIRQHKNSAGIPAALVMIAVAGFVIFRETSAGHGLPPGISTRAYYTTEDRLTGDAALTALFVDDVNKAPPFDHNGKPAFLAIVYQCNHGRTRWVNCLKRYTPQMQKRVQSAMDESVAKGKHTVADTSDFDGSGTQLKPPGDHPWVGAHDKDFEVVRSCHLPPEADVSDLSLDVP